MRRLLKARELGLPEGDTSTMETDASPANGAAPASRDAAPDAPGGSTP
jgi:acetyl-CoA synthetase